ncbi:uncharacterized protein LOC107803254 isoform X2 [Nicotiana tabacum]|uniref:Uncharacterized protein LOC107803254 isoform X2 n=1 Tax=Nicotiana tabacum TaxID=4097 RepID=A0AC58SI74_TOBAC
MEGVGARFGRSSTRYGPTTVFTGPVRRWKKKWIHVSSNKNNHQTTTAAANGGVNGSSGSHLLLLKWRPITASQNNSSDEKDGDPNKDEVVPIEEPRKRKFKFIPCRTSLPASQLFLLAPTSTSIRLLCLKIKSMRRQNKMRMKLNLWRLMPIPGSQHLKLMVLMKNLTSTICRWKKIRIHRINLQKDKI